MIWSNKQDVTNPTIASLYHAGQSRERNPDPERWRAHEMQAHGLIDGSTVQSELE